MCHTQGRQMTPVGSAEALQPAPSVFFGVFKYYFNAQRAKQDIQLISFRILNFFSTDSRRQLWSGNIAPISSTARNENIPLHRNLQ